MIPVRLTVFSGLSLLLLSAPAWPEQMAPMALNSLSVPPAKAASAKVLDQNGQLLGQVERIQTDEYGKPLALSFRAAKNGKIVVISAAAASYDGNVLVAGNDQPQIAPLLEPQRTATTLSN
jgi:hypothetical protein